MNEKMNEKSLEITVKEFFETEWEVSGFNGLKGKDACIELESPNGWKHTWISIGNLIHIAQNHSDVNMIFDCVGNTVKTEND